jgi:hypothetical protein
MGVIQMAIDNNLNNISNEQRMILNENLITIFSNLSQQNSQLMILLGLSLPPLSLTVEKKNEKR